MWVHSEEHPKHTSSEGMVGVDVANQAPQVPLRQREGRWAGGQRGRSARPAAVRRSAPGRTRSLLARRPHPPDEEALSGALEACAHAYRHFQRCLS